MNDTVAICDPQPIAMEGLRSLLESMGGPRVVAVNTNVEDSVRAVRDLQPSMLVVDKSFGASNLSDWIHLSSTVSQALAVIVWGTPISEAEALRFLQAGSAGVIRKTSSLADMTSCIRAVAAGGNWMESDGARDSRTARGAGRSALTPREMQVMDMVQRGYKNREIGQALDIRTGTVKIHLKHIFEKTGIHGRYGLAISGLKQNGFQAAAV